MKALVAARAALRGWMVLAALVLIHGCQAIVPSDPPSFVCSGTSLAACPGGMYCKGAGCAPCEANDVCDGFDNDCNGTVDDGEKLDRDGDGATVCGHLDPNGEIVGRDCDDDDNAVKPEAAEVCNGRDDNCDGKVDESVCPDNRVCAPKKGCVDKASACDPQVAGGCPPGKVCDPGTLACVGNAVLKMGATCVADQECDRGSFCAPTTLLPNGIGAVCTQGCCSSADCPADFVCLPQGAGGNYCVSAKVLGRDTLGSVIGGAACITNAECRSGICDAKHCEDPCCSDVTCGAGTLCRATAFVGSSHFTFGCAVKNGSQANFASCSTLRCEKGACAEFVEGDVCVSTCCGSVGCGTFNGDSVMCREVAPLGHKDDRVFACSLIVAGTTFKAMGEPCVNASECRGNICQGDPKTGASYCSDLCCKDSDCSAALSCLPYASSGIQVLRCQRKQ